MATGGLRLFALVILTATFGAGCEGDDTEIDVFATPTPGGVRTATPAGSTPVRTATPVVSATPGAATATAGGPTATAGGPTVTAGGPTVTAGGPTATATGPTATPTPGAVDAEVATVVGDVLPFFTVAGLSTGVGTASAEEAARAPGRGIGVATQAVIDVDNCPDGGTRTQDDQVTTITVTLAACKFTDPDLGSFQFDGTIVATLLSQSASFNVTTQDLINTRTVTFAGSVPGTPGGGGGLVLDGGPITITTPDGNFTLTVDDFTIDGSGNVTAGGGTITDNNDLFDLQQIVFTIRTGGLLADLVATFDDTTTAEYVVDLKKGDITPAP